MVLEQTPSPVDRMIVLHGNISRLHEIAEKKGYYRLCWVEEL